MSTAHTSSVLGALCQVGEGAVPVACPGHSGGCDGCQGTVTDGELFLLLPSHLFQRYKRFAALADNRNLRECPKCGLLQVRWEGACHFPAPLSRSPDGGYCHLVQW